MPEHGYLPANIPFLCFIGHQGWIIHETWFHMLIASGGKVPACSASGKWGRSAAAQGLVPSRDQPCAHELLRQGKQLQWPQLWRQLFAHRLWWQKCVVGFSWTACPSPATHGLAGAHSLTHTNNSMLSITLHYHQRRKKPPLTIWGPEWAMQQSVESALHLTCKIVGRGESVASSECQHFLSFRYQKVCACMRFTMTYCLDSVLFTCLMDWSMC